MVYFSATLVTILAVEMLFRLPLKRLVARLIASNRKVVRVVLSNAISDHWKQKVLLAYSSEIALITLKIAAIIGGVALVVLLTSMGFDKMLGLDEPTIGFLSTWQGISVATLASIAFFLVRRSYVAK